MENKNYDEIFKMGIYIPSIEACWLYKENEENGEYKVNNAYLDKLLVGKLDFSYELIQDKILINKIDTKKINDRLYTLDIINVKYDKQYKKFKKKNDENILIDKKNTKELRYLTYKNGFKLNGKKFTNWKRSSGKAREGQNLFIIDEIKNKCLEWSRMKLNFDDKVSIASVRAYESLPLSSIIGAINIDPSSILVIKDYESVFHWKMSKTWLDGNKLKTETDDNKIEKNSIWDGMGLLDKSIFDANEIIKNKGMALLRNRYMKCAAFNCNLQQYYMDYCQKSKLDYNKYFVKDIYGNPIKVKDIRLITTPSSLKIIKFNKVVLKKLNKNEDDTAWLRYWKEHCGNIFGVCKTEKPSHYNNGKMQRLSYQMINTIPFVSSLEIQNLISPEVKYVKRLKDDLNFFLQEVNQMTTEDFISEADDNTDTVEIGKYIDVTGAFIELSKKNEEFVNTQVFKDYKRNFINAYVKQLRRGKIRIEGDYCVACGNPVEMLKATTGNFNGTSTLKKNELYCSRFTDGENVVGFRNPSINVGNIGIQVNKYILEINKYFNCTPNIVFLNSIKYPTLSIYQGEDFDSDCNLLTNDKIIIQACKNIDKNITPIPVNCIENTGNNNNYITAENMCNIDHTISQNYIGSVINLSQEINSIMNHLKYNKLATQKELDILYKYTSQLSSISCTEIDKAKKQFKELKVQNELDNIKDFLIKKKYFNLTEDNRRKKAKFFKYVGDTKAIKQRVKTNKKHKKEMDEDTKKKFCKDNKINRKDLDEKDEKLIKLLKENNKIYEEWKNEIYEDMDTPMDWLEKELDKIKNKKKVATVQVIQLVKENKHKANMEIVQKVVHIIKELNELIKSYRLNPDLVAKDKIDKIRIAKKQASKKIKKMNITKANMYGILKQCLNSIKKNKKINKKTGIESISLEILFKAYGTGLLDMFL
ncbi:hypothetical protein [Clostridium tyrobutyricum]|uniref:hypothetical protein n=1 Tax=Clostridium tyrobutyricum TaxID=1519 RepID=UPI001C393EF8|nr:hypothetical protein [Clostridium tyrobutyricum]MBV4427614.1 hypothetical protein [Clostridium tyrobutyricum]MBV4442649.1 hypothetical protein [Clostridium tyrobutyricum]